MNKAIRYDNMVKNPSDDRLGFFEKYFENMDFVQGKIREINPIKIYDIGCGTGNLTGELSDEYSVLGVDLSENMLSRAKDKFPSLTTRCQGIEEFISETTPQQGELVVSSLLLHAIANKGEIFDWIETAINSGAKVIILDYMFDSQCAMDSYVKGFRDKGEDQLADIISRKHYIKIDELKRWGSNAGINIDIEMLTHWIGVIEISK